MTIETTPEAPEAPPLGPIARIFQQVLPGLELEAVPTPTDETITIRRDDFRRVMDAARNDERLAFDYLRCQSGVDWITELESVYTLYSFKNRHGVTIKVRCPYEDAHIPTVSHLWAAANWHERETHEMFGIVYDGHPDLRPLLTEEGLGYFILRKSHPLADIEEWQEDYIETIEKAKAQMAAAAGEAPVLDEKALKIQMAQKKAAVMKKARDEARAQGMTPEAEKAYVQEAVKKFEEDEAAARAAAPAPAAPVDPKALKIQQAQAKAKVITKARDYARAQGMSTEEEKLYVAEQLKKFSEVQAAAAPAAPARPEVSKGRPEVSKGDRATKIQQAQAKAKIITKAREEARAQGLSPEDERKYVAEALKKFAEEQAG